MPALIAHCRRLPSDYTPIAMADGDEAATAQSPAESGESAAATAAERRRSAGGTAPGDLVVLRVDEGPLGVSIGTTGVVGRVVSGGPADQAGVRVAMRCVGVNGKLAAVSEETTTEKSASPAEEKPGKEDVDGGDGAGAVAADEADGGEEGSAEARKPEDAPLSTEDAVGAAAYAMVMAAAKQRPIELAFKTPAPQRTKLERDIGRLGGFIKRRVSQPSAAAASVLSKAQRLSTPLLQSTLKAVDEGSRTLASRVDKSAAELEAAASKLSKQTATAVTRAGQRLSVSVRGASTAKPERTLSPELVKHGDEFVGSIRKRLKGLHDRNAELARRADHADATIASCRGFVERSRADYEQFAAAVATEGPSLEATIADVSAQVASVAEKLGALEIKVAEAVEKRAESDSAAWVAQQHRDADAFAASKQRQLAAAKEEARRAAERAAKLAEAAAAAEKQKAEEEDQRRLRAEAAASTTAAPRAPAVVGNVVGGEDDESEEDDDSDEGGSGDPVSDAADVARVRGRQKSVAAIVQKIEARTASPGGTPSDVAPIDEGKDEDAADANAETDAGEGTSPGDAAKAGAGSAAEGGAGGDGADSTPAADTGAGAGQKKKKKKRGKGKR